VSVSETEAAARPYPDQWSRESATPVVERYHSAVRALVAERFAASGKSWEEAVESGVLEPTREDLEKIEADLLAEGYKFDVSATISLKEEPDKYKPLAGIADSGEQESDEEGRLIVGTGDNVFKAPADVTGTARYISDVDRVMEMLTNGVPEQTIAIIDDSGGTLTAPILGDFTAVVCMGGTVRSHLGILTREYNVPCLMNAQLDGLADGDEVTVEYSKPAADAYASAEAASEHRARIVKTSQGE
jgi:phosphohistidine swiveling domain-containing protein